MRLKALWDSWACLLCFILSFAPLSIFALILRLIRLRFQGLAPRRFPSVSLERGLRAESEKWSVLAGVPSGRCAVDSRMMGYVNI